MKKARQIEYQKLQRKERKEKKDIEKFSNRIKQLEDQLSELKQSDKCSRENGTIMKFETITSSGIIIGRDSNGKKPENRAEQSDDPSTNIVSVENGESTNAMADGNLLTSDESSTPNNPKNIENEAPKGHETENTKDKPSKVTLSASDSNVFKTNINALSTLIFNEGM